MKNLISSTRTCQNAAMFAAALLASCVWSTRDAFAEIKDATVKVEGLSCPFCAYGLEKNLAKVEGVAQLSTDLKSGTINLNLEKKARISVRALKEAVRRAGFTMGPVTITARGVLEEKNDQWVLSIKESHQEFLLFEDSAWKGDVHSGHQAKLLTDGAQSALQKLKRDGNTVTVTGKIHDHADGPAGLLVESYKASP